MTGDPVKIVAAKPDWAVALSTFISAKEQLRTANRGTISCPKCSAVLTFWVEGRKRHSRGLCVTPGCIAWIE